MRFAHADEDRLVQVLVNLLSNAIKYSESGSKIRICSLAESGYVKVQVFDIGRGIPKELQESIFDRFKQVERKDEFEKGGSGLGLAICKAIIEKHGGRIGLESEVGKGSCFWFELPEFKES